MHKVYQLPLLSDERSCDYYASANASIIFVVFYAFLGLKNAEIYLPQASYGDTILDRQGQKW